MEILELKPLKKKKVYLYLIKHKDNDFSHLNLNHLSDFIEENKFRFAIIDFNNNSSKESYIEPLTKFLEDFNIPHYDIDIPEGVKNYLLVEILEKEVLLKELEEEFENINPEDLESYKAQSLKSWIDLLKRELENQKRNLEYNVKPSWIVKKALDIIRNIKYDRFSIMHFAPETLFNQLKALFEEYNIKVIKIDNKNGLYNPYLT